jgi:hypothetical protein
LKVLAALVLNLPESCVVTSFRRRRCSHYSRGQRQWLASLFQVRIQVTHVFQQSMLPARISSFLLFLGLRYVTLSEKIVIHNEDTERKLPCNFTYKLNKKFLSRYFPPRRPAFKPGSVMWDLWWTKWHWGRFSPSTSVSPTNLHSTNLPTVTITYHLGLVQ